MNFSITTNHEFRVFEPDMNGDFAGYDYEMILGPGIYPIIDILSATQFVICDGDLEAGEGCNWILDLDEYKIPQEV